jgi:hypothetical protein
VLKARIRWAVEEVVCAQHSQHRLDSRMKDLAGSPTVVRFLLDEHGF